MVVHHRPFEHNYRSLHTATLLANGQVLVAGGEGDVGTPTSAEFYDPVMGIWSVTGDLNTPRNQHSATLLTNGQVLVVGSEVGIPDTELYDPDTGTWTVTGMLHTRRSWGHTATLLPDGKVLVTGGYLGVPNYLFLASAELYDPTTGIWTTTGSMKKGRHWAMPQKSPLARINSPIRRRLTTRSASTVSARHNRDGIIQLCNT